MSDEARRAEFEAWYDSETRPFDDQDCSPYKASRAGYLAGYKAGVEAMAETCAKACDEMAERYWREYKRGPGPHRADPEWQGRSNGADECAQACRDAARALGERT